MTWTDAKGPKEPRRLNELLGSMTSRLGIASPRVIAAVFEGWGSLVGEPLATHVRPVGIRDGVLHLEADEPGWASQMRYLEGDVLRLVNERIAVPGDEAPVTAVSVRVANRRARRGAPPQSSQ